MATIVKHIETGKHLILVGCGFGAYKSSSSDSMFGHTISKKDDSGELPMVALAFANGQIFWCDSREVEVISIDGQAPKDLLEKF